MGEPGQPVLHKHDRYYAVADDVARFMRREAADEIEFDVLALEIFAFQFANNTAYANYCRSLAGGANPEPSCWREIPALSTDAFKIADFPVTSFPAVDAQQCFQSSGTTAETRGRHYFLNTGLYRDSILLGWRELELPELPVSILTLSPEDAPDSSLSFMMGVLAEEFSAGEPNPFLIDADGAIAFDRLEERCRAGEPMLVLGTALAFMHLFENHEALELPAGSWALETGGYKGTQRRLRREELVALFEERLGLPPSQIINEYSMCELSSQFYTAGLGNPHRGPHWTRAQVLDPETGREAGDGETGILRIVDLANLGSVIAITTRDLAVRRGDRFELLGRDPEALPKGCSLSADEMLTPDL